MAQDGDYSRLKMELNRLKQISKGAAVDVGKGLLFRKRFTNDDLPIKTSVLGTDVYTNLTFQGGSFLPLGEFAPINYGALEIDTILMTVSQAKNIVTTQIQGKTGTFKEYINDGDFQIDVRGLLVGSEPNIYPTEQVEALVRLFSVPDTLRVTSEFLSHFGLLSPSAPLAADTTRQEASLGIFTPNSAPPVAGLSGIDDVVIVDYSFPQLEGFRNQQPFTCKMVSDTPIELLI